MLSRTKGSEMDIRTALPPVGSAVRDTQFNRYGIVTGRSGRRCTVQYIDKSARVVYASTLVVIRKVRTVY